MLRAIIVLLFAILALESQAAVKEIYLPTLECGEHTFQDVSVNFDDERADKKQITVSLICDRLKARLVKQPVVTELSRFVVDKMAPQEVEKIGPRANDFFRMVIFKKDIIGKKEFDFTDQKIEDIVEKMRNPRYMRLRTFTPSKDHMHVLAYHTGGSAYLNSYKTDRNECSMINTLVHEYMHFIGYSHGDNSPEGKENSVPYYFGKRAEELCEAGVI